MDLTINVTVQTPADVLRYARAGALDPKTAARTCLKMSGWTEKEVDAAVPVGKKAVKKKPGAKRTGRPSMYDTRKDDIRSVVALGVGVPAAAEMLGVSVPTARAWLSRMAEEEAGRPEPQPHYGAA
jgi:hypothetical protein